MSSEIYEFDGCFFNDSFTPFNDSFTPFNDSFSPFNDSSSNIDILQPFQEHNYTYTPLLPSSPPPPLTSHENLDETDQIIPTLLSTSPPNLENLSLYQKGISVTSSNEALDFCPSEVKIEKTSSSNIDILQPFQEHNYTYTPLLPSSPPPLTSHENLDETDQIIPTLLSTSPPNLENLSLYQKGISVTSSNEALDFCPSEVKIEKTQLPFYDPYYYCGSDNAFKMMQRSYSSSSFPQGRSNGVIYQPKFNGLIDAPYLDSQVLTSPDHCFSSTPMRRVCSTGDLQSHKVKETSQRLSSSPLCRESSFMEESNFKVGCYNAEERKEKISKYRAKRTQRNFNKTIKYACRKTLADNRPRIRGRFARNDEPGELPKSTTFHQYGVEDELWIDGFNEEDGEVMIGRPQFFNTY